VKCFGKKGFVVHFPQGQAMEETGVPEVVGDVLTWWFGIQFWSKGEPKNPTAHYDDLWRQKYSVPSSHKTFTHQQDLHPP
jgi:hypothetical protein